MLFLATVSYQTCLIWNSKWNLNCSYVCLHILLLVTWLFKYFLFLLQQILKKENKRKIFCKEQLSHEDEKNYESDLRKEYIEYDDIKMLDKKCQHFDTKNVVETPAFTSSITLLRSIFTPVCFIMP